MLSILVTLSRAPVGAQGITSVPANFVLDGSVGEWEGVPPGHKTYEGGITGSVDLWTGVTGQGLVIAGRIGIHPWKFELKRESIESGGPLDIRLSVVDPFELPKLEFDEDSCRIMADGKADRQSACLQWVKDQLAYRELLQRQFVRFWRVAPDGAEEGYALPAYDRLSEQQRKALGFPRPAGLPVRLFRTASDGSPTFELLIPWEMFPPANRLSLDRIKLELDLEPDGGVGDIPSAAALGRFGGISVTPPISTRITTCSQPLPAFAFYFLSRSREIDTTFRFDDHLNSGEWVWVPFPPPVEDLSPIIRYEKSFTQSVGPGEFLCGPYLSYRRGAISKNFPMWIAAPVSELQPLPVLRSADGIRLIRSGPSSSLWGGRHGSYQTFRTTILALTPSLQAYQALNLDTTISGPTGYEVEISDDWRTVKEFKQSLEGKWSSETFCLQGHVYRSCAQDPDSQPPKKRVLTQDPN